MKRGSTLFLQVVIVLIGLAALTFLLWEPHVEGRNAHATLFEIYFKDPFMAFVYVASVSFFVALYHAFKVVGYAGQNRVFSQDAVNSLRMIKYCAMAMVGFVAIGEIFILSQQGEDRAGGVFMGLLVAFGSVVMATTAAMFQQILQKAVDLKSENDLTV